MLGRYVNQRRKRRLGTYVQKNEFSSNRANVQQTATSAREKIRAINDPEASNENENENEEQITADADDYLDAAENKPLLNRKHSAATTSETVSESSSSDEGEEGINVTMSNRKALKNACLPITLHQLRKANLFMKLLLLVKVAIKIQK
jgi:hypothetical protein